MASLSVDGQCQVERCELEDRLYGRYGRANRAGAVSEGGADDADGASGEGVERW